jgi:hypothetical protein
MKAPKWASRPTPKGEPTPPWRNTDLFPTAFEDNEHEESKKRQAAEYDMKNVKKWKQHDDTTAKETAGYAKEETEEETDATVATVAKEETEEATVAKEETEEETEENTTAKEETDATLPWRPWYGSPYRRRGATTVATVAEEPPPPRRTPANRRQGFPNTYCREYRHSHQCVGAHPTCKSLIPMGAARWRMPHPWEQALMTRRRQGELLAHLIEGNQIEGTFD